MAKDCLNHSGAPAVVHCHQCAKPLCTACVHVMPYGRFCSIECGMLYQDYQKQKKQAKSGRPSMLVTAMGIMIFALAMLGLFIGFHFLVEKSDSATLKRYDLFGRLLYLYQKKHTSPR